MSQAGIQVLRLQLVHKLIFYYFQGFDRKHGIQNYSAKKGHNLITLHNSHMPSLRLGWDRITFCVQIHGVKNLHQFKNKLKI